MSTMSGRPLGPRRPITWQTYAWLIYSVPFLVASFDSKLTRLETGAMLAGYVAFLALYFTGQRMRGPRIAWLIVGLDVLAVMFSRKNPGAGSFVIYAAAMVACGFAPRAAAIVLGVQVAAGAALIAAVGFPWWLAGMFALISALIGAVTIQAEVSEADNAKLRVAQAEVERLAQVAERERIARDLHDLLGHTLSVVVLKSELARKLVAHEPTRAAQEMAEVERIARDGLSEVRQAISGYRATGLLAEIGRVHQALTSAGIEATIEAAPVPLSPEQENALSLALREATTNVIRHAAATRCDVRFREQDGSVVMEIADNGRGGDAPFGNGLTGMRERIQALGGVLARETDRGTRLLIRLPI